MDFITDYPKLEAHQQERFKVVVTRLLSGQVITPGTPLKPDPDWRFTERFGEMIDDYLMVGGWRLDLDVALRMARAKHENGSQRVRLSKLESLVLCALRLYYHEQMSAAAEEERTQITVGALRERLVAAGKPASQLSARTLGQSIRRLARHSLVTTTRGFEGQDEEVLVVNPLIEKVLPPDQIQAIAVRIESYLGGRAAPNEGGADSEDGEEDETP